MESHRHPSERPLPPISVYLYVGAILIIVTAVEVAAFYLDVPSYVLIPILIVLSLMKFVLVVMFFMHLRYDHKIFSSVFILGLVLALGITLGLITLFDNFDVGNPPVAAAPTPIPTITLATPAIPGGGVDPNLPAGAQAFLNRGCNGCHVIEGLPGAVGVVGPDLTGLAGRAGDRVPGLSAEEYVRQSVEAPQDFLVEGYDNLMLPLRDTIGDEEFESLVEYLLTLR